MSTLEALNGATIINKFVYSVYQLNFAYLQINAVMKIIKDHELETFEQQFEMTCRLKVRIRLSKVDVLLTKFTFIDGVSVDYMATE